MNLASITAVVIGGTSLFGGRGHVLGTLLGALIIGVFSNGLSLTGVDVLWQVFTTASWSSWPSAWTSGHERSQDDNDSQPRTTGQITPILSARNLVKRYGHVTALDGADLDPVPRGSPRRDRRQRRREIIPHQCLSGAVVPDEGEISGEDNERFRTPLDAGQQELKPSTSTWPSLQPAT